MAEKRNITVLVADDSEDNRILLQRLLELNGFHPILAENGLHALRLIERNPSAIDLALVDIVMPKMNGLELTQHLRSWPLEQYIPVLLLTALDDPTDIETGLASGADDYMTKPFSSLELKARINNILRIRRIENQLRQNYALMRRDLEAARELQLGLIPQSPLQSQGIQFCWEYQPCHYVAGDMLNVFRVDDEHIAMYVADVSGHGVAAAMLSIWLAHTLKPTPKLSQKANSLQLPLASPQQTCEFLDQRIFQPESERYLTLFYAVYNTKTRQFTYCRCGHPRPMLLSPDGSLAPLALGDSPAIGMGLELPFQTHQITLHPHDRLFIYSDGLIEANAPNGEHFGMKRFSELLLQSRELPIQEQLKQTWKKIQEFQVKLDFDDDVTLFALEILPTSHP